MLSSIFQNIYLVAVIDISCLSQNIVPMRIRQASLITFEQGQTGSTRNACEVCGRYTLSRLRMVVEEPGNGKYLKVVNICRSNNCLEYVFGTNVGSHPVKAGKIRSNASNMVTCSFCLRDARGGVYVRGGLFSAMISNLCPVCLVERIDDMKEAMTKENADKGIKGSDAGAE